MSETTDWRDSPAANLNLTRLGQIALKLPLIALQLGHVSLANSSTYLHPDTPEARFMIDLLGLGNGRERDISTEESCERWFGGSSEALALFGAMFEVHAGAGVPF